MGATVLKPDEEDRGTDADPRNGRAIAHRERLRIEAEIEGLDEGTDPFVAAVRATRMPMIITNPRVPDNPVVFTNDAFCRLTGYSRDEIVGRNCRFLQGPDTDRAVIDRVREAVVNRQSIQVDIRNHRKDGTAFWNRLLLAPVRDAAGEVAYFFASQVDVTLERERLLGLENQNAALMAELGDRLRAQEAIESRLRFASRAGGLGIWELDCTTGSIYASPAGRENLGLAPGAAVDREALRAAIHPDDRLRVDQAFERSLRTGEDCAIEYRVVRPDGAVGWVQVRAQVDLDRAGVATRMAGTSVDATAANVARERTQVLLDLDECFNVTDDPVETAYRAAEALGRLLGVSRAGYGTIDLAAETVTIERDWNAPGVETLAGVLHFREYGSYIEDLKVGTTVVIADARLDPRTAPTADALAAISARAFINMPVTESNGFVALLYLNHAEARPWTDDELAFVREVAHRTRMAVQRRRAEKSLAALAATLEAQVVERTAALMQTEEALRQAQKMEAVGQLTGGIAHDFNNLLAGLGASLEILERRIGEGRTHDAERYIASARGSARRAASLTQRLLAFSRRQTLDPKPVDVNRLVVGMEELIRRSVGPAVEVEVVGAGGLWATRADPAQLENSLLNLCINARDAMAPHGGRLTIETANKWLDDRTARERGVVPGQYVSLCVTDTGTGMSPEVISRAFDPFFTTKPLGAGTGLGLSMVYGFVRQSGGTVRIYSEVGKGTTICLYLPRHAGPAEAAPTESLEDMEPGDGETVLVIEDETTIREFLIEELQDNGYRVLSAPDGAAGIRILDSGVRIDLLITDVGLPGGINGRQVADAARVSRPGLKTLFITGFADNAAVGNGQLERGMEILTKPFDLAALGGRIRTMLDR